MLRKSGRCYMPRCSPIWEEAHATSGCCSGGADAHRARRSPGRVAGVHSLGCRRAAAHRVHPSLGRVAGVRTSGRRMAGAVPGPVSLLEARASAGRAKQALLTAVGQQHSWYKEVNAMKLFGLRGVALPVVAISMT